MGVDKIYFVFYTIGMYVWRICSHGEVYAREPFSKENQSSYVFRLSSADKMRPSDLGLNEDMRYFRLDEPGSSPFVTIMPIYECDNFSVSHFPPRGFLGMPNFFHHPVYA